MSLLDNIKSIKIGFENCVVSQNLSFKDWDKSDVKFLKIENIVTDIHLNCGRLFEDTKCNRIYIVLDKCCNTHYDEYGSESEDNLFDRIQRFSDITDIGLTYEDESIKWIYVPWNHEQEYSSDYQHTMLDEIGNLHICIDGDFKGFDSNILR